MSDSAKSYRMETSITLDYRKQSWGLERIVLDGIANHLPSDSGGTEVDVRLKQNGEYVDIKDVDSSESVDEVVFQDNGSGYDARLLSILFSTKETGASSVGQFGEGLKMIAAASLRENVSLRYLSRNWIATPIAMHEQIGEREVDRLAFDIIENGQQVAGSQTVFSNPSSEFVEQVLSLPEKVLVLNDDHEVLTSGISWGSYANRIVQMGDGSTSLFIKGVRVDSRNSLFSYDLGLSNITPDRIFADEKAVMNSIENLLKNNSTKRIREKVLTAAFAHPEANYDEFRAFEDRRPMSERSESSLFSLGEKSLYSSLDTLFAGYNLDKLSNYDFSGFTYNPDVKLKLNSENSWADSFREMFGDDAVLAEYDPAENTDAELLGYKPVKLPPGLKDYLTKNGVERVSNLVSGEDYRWADNEMLEPEELAVLGCISDINELLLENSIEVDVRVYSGVFTKTGREITSNPGVYQKGKNGSEFIGIKRSQLGSIEEFLPTYIHELGHQVTGAIDSSREFTDFFVQSLSKIVQHYVA